MLDWTSCLGPGRRYVQILASMAANLGQLAVGQCVGMSSYMLPQINSEDGDLHLSEAQGSTFGNAPNHFTNFIEICLASIFVVGLLTGSLVGGYQSDLLGRRRSMMLDSVTMLLGLIAISLAPGWEVLLLGIFQWKTQNECECIIRGCRTPADGPQLRQQPGVCANLHERDLLC